MRYHDFDIRIGRGPAGTITLNSHCDVHGDWQDVATIDPDILERDETLLTGESIEHDALIDVGARLYSYIFAAKEKNIEFHFAQCLGLRPERDGGVRLRLVIESPDLAVVPWEYIFSQRLRAFLGVSERTPIVRFLNVSQPIGSLATALPVQMLVAIPEGSGLDTESERKQLLKTLEPLHGVVEIKTLAGEVTRKRIADELAVRRFNLFHFIGHGDFERDRAVLFLNRAGGGDDEPHDHESIASLFRNHSSMKLVVLNSCRGGQLSSSKPFVGMGGELVRLGVPAVVAMQYEILDEQAVCFAREFYRHLFLGNDRGRIEIAISHARSALADEFRDSNAVGLPVLFMHAQEGVLYDLVTGTKLHGNRSSRVAETAEAIIRTHRRDLEIVETQPGPVADRLADVSPVVVREELDRAVRWLRFRNLTIVAIAGIVLLLSAAAMFFGFQLSHPAFSPDRYFVAFSDLFPHQQNTPSVMMVAVDSATTRALGEPDSTWRGRHSVVVERLARSGARVIAFNLTFAERRSEGLRSANDSLARAFRQARASGATILVAVDSFSNGIPNIAPQLAPFVVWGVNCVEKHPIFTAHALRVTIASANQGKPRRLHSLPLAAVAAFEQQNFNDDAPVRSSLASRPGSGRAASAVFVDSVVAVADDMGCQQQRGDTVYRMIVDLTKRSELRSKDHRISYLDVFQGEPIGDVRGKLVLVGNERTSSSFNIQRGFARETRFGLELEADAINTLLRRVTIRPLPLIPQFAVILLMGVLGALAALAFIRFGGLGAVVGLLVAVPLYIGIGAALYGAYHVLLNTLFDVLALILTSLVVWIVHRRWFPMSFVRVSRRRKTVQLPRVAAAVAAIWLSGCALKRPLGRVESVVVRGRSDLSPDSAQVRVIRRDSVATPFVRMRLEEGDSITTSDSVRVVIDFAVGYRVTLDSSTAIYVETTPSGRALHDPSGSHLMAALNGSADSRAIRGRDARIRIRRDFAALETHEQVGIITSIFLRIGRAFIERMRSTPDSLTISTPGARLHDTGTRYMVSVNAAGRTSLTVLDGLVRAESRDAAAAWPPIIYTQYERGEYGVGSRPRRMGRVQPREVEAQLRWVRDVEKVTVRWGGVLAPVVVAAAPSNKCAVPKVIGLSRSAAERLLESNGLKGEGTRDRGTIDEVTSQVEPAGTEVDCGSVVHYRWGKIG